MEKDLALRFIESYRNQDRDGILDLLAEDVVVSDPHFPVTTMIGKRDVKRGLNWSFSAIKRSDLEIVNLSVNGSRAHVELDTTHILKVGLQYHYLQLLKIEFANEKISSITTFVTYSPGGLRGFLRRGFALAWQVSDGLKNISIKPMTLSDAP
jgi:ketosteroid isomerase-like protein